MNILSNLRSRLLSLVHGHRHRDSDLDDEIRAHLAEQSDALMVRGLSERDARAAARRAFGNVSVLTERSRDEWRWPWLEALKMDVRHAFRLVRRYPAFSTNIILISAIGVAACAATFGLVSGVLLSPLPFAKPDEVYALQLHSSEGNNTNALSIEAFLQIADSSPVIGSIAAAVPGVASVRWGSELQSIQLQRITPSFFSVFGVAPMRGRQFTSDDASRETPVLLLGYALWQSRFGGDTAVVGSSITLDSVLYTIVGVMPSRFRAHFNSEPDVWLPLRVAQAAGRGRNSLSPQVRLRSGVTAAQADSWLAASVRVRMKSRASRDSVNAVPVTVPIREMIYGAVTRPLQILMASVLLVLLLIVANVATMFLCRSSARDHELGVRRALGASTARQLTQLVTESTVLVSIGGILGIAASYWLVAGVHQLGERILPRMDAVTFDWRVAAFAIVATLVTGALGGLPAAFAARKELRNSSSGSRVTGRRTSSALVVAQISLSVVLLVGAGLLVKGFLRVLPSSPGFAVENRLMLLVSLPEENARNGTPNNGAPLFFSSVAERMRRVSGVQNVAAMSYVPFFGSAYIDEIELGGYPVPAKPLSAFQNVVTPNLLEVLEIVLKDGRSFTGRDDAGGEQVAIVNQTAAKRWWPNERAIGKRVTVKRGTERVPVTVVGVMSDSRLMGSDTKIRAEIYLPLAQVKTSAVSFVVQTDGRQPAMVADLKRAIWAVAPDLAISNSGELATYAMDSVREPRFFAWVMGIFAMVAVALSAAAVYGLLTLDVVQRRTEIGVRMALGATGARIGALVLRRAVILAVSGIFIGVLAARALGRSMESLLIEVTATDASVFLLTIALTLLIASIAACAPAFRAVRVDPAQSLRGE